MGMEQSKMKKAEKTQTSGMNILIQLQNQKENEEVPFRSWEA